MALVGMMQVTLNEIIGVVSVRDGLMSAIRAVNMSLWMARDFMIASAAIGMPGIHFDDVFIDLFAFRMFEMTVLQIIGVAMMFDGYVPATRTVLVFIRRFHIQCLSLLDVLFGCLSHLCGFLH